MMTVCEVCSNQRIKGVQIAIDPPVIGRAGSADDKIICEKCTTKNPLDCDRCKTCGAGLFGDIAAPSKPKEEDIVQCRHCSFENHKENKSCLGCEKSLTLIPVEKAPGSEKEISLKQCPICSCILEESLHSRHVSECMESIKLMEKLELEHKSESTDECPYCQLRFDKSVSEKHIVECSKNGDFFKQQRVFGRMTKVQKETIEFMHTNSQKQHFSAKPQL